jgi:hypothetical protein
MIIQLILGGSRYAEAGPSQKLSAGCPQSPARTRNIVANVTVMKAWVNATAIRSNFSPGRLFPARKNLHGRDEPGQVAATISDFEGWS